MTIVGGVWDDPAADLDPHISTPPSHTLNTVGDRPDPTKAPYGVADWRHSLEAA